MKYYKEYEKRAKKITNWEIENSLKIYILIGINFDELLVFVKNELK